ncbi:MAG: hypothetical protein IKP62_02720 [Salinivirgaceae bacterium]|nr:hypothetical protein [Salinivirgaceae bacterium]
MDWLDANIVISIIACFAAFKSAKAASVASKIAKMAEDRERRFCNAAIVDWKIDLPRKKLFLYNNGNGSAYNVVLTSEGFEFSERGNTYEIELLCPKQECQLSIENYESQYSITIVWNDKYKSGNKSQRDYCLIDDKSIITKEMLNETEQ